MICTIVCNRNRHVLPFSYNSKSIVLKAHSDYRRRYAQYLKKSFDTFVRFDKQENCY